jgi:excisionase family DNA binding protein
MTTPLAPSRPLLSIAQLAKCLNVDHSTIYRYLKDPVHPLPALRVDERYRFSIDEVDAWMRRERS